MEKSRIFNFVSVLLMGILLVLQFMPFWSGDGATAAIQGYVWFPSGHPIEPYLMGQLGESFAVNSIVLMPILVLVLGVAGIVLCIWKSDVSFMALIPLACGLVGIWGYLSQPAFQLGANWVLHLFVCIGMLASAIMTFVFAAKND